jgi:hypothetical protein
MITPLDQPMDPLDNMTPEEVKALEDWEEHFKVCFPCIETNIRRSIFSLERLWSLVKNLPI